MLTMSSSRNFCTLNRSQQHHHLVLMFPIVLVYPNRFHNLGDRSRSCVTDTYTCETGASYMHIAFRPWSVLGSLISGLKVTGSQMPGSHLLYTCSSHISPAGHIFVVRCMPRSVHS